MMPDQNKKSMSIPRRFINMFLSSQLDFRVRLFNVLAMGGTLISLFVFFLAIANNNGIINIGGSILSSALSAALLILSYKTGRYQLCYMVTIIVIFICLFPIFFFSAGGYHSGMPVFFVFAVTFTIFMLEGKKAIAFSVAELIIYTAICVTAYLYPEMVNYIETESAFLIDVIVSFVTVSAVLGVCLFIHFRLYNEQQRKLDEQNVILEQANRAKTEFLANASHEMRTPLTVTSVNVQLVMKILENMGGDLDDPEARELLKSAQSEIMRLSRMVSGMLTLASMSESTNRQKLDFSALMQSGIEMLRLTLSERGNAVKTEIESGLIVFGNADLLAQVLTNLLQNARAHTTKGMVAVSAKKQGNEITVTVQDTGIGISPELLPRLFERGVSTGGTGYGLFLCKTVVESHGGKIWIESEQGKGTTVHYTLPSYEGQFGPDGHS